MGLRAARGVLDTKILIRKGNCKAKRKSILVSIVITLDTKVYKF